MKQEKYELLKEIIKERVSIGDWKIDLENGTLTTKRGVIKGRNNEGYVNTLVKYGGKNVQIYIHQIMVVVANLDVVGKVVNHIDGDKTNNSISNLECVTHRQNSLHAHANNLFSNHKLTKDNVREIKLMLLEGLFTQTFIARKFNVSPPTIRAIKNGKIHKDVIV